MSRNGVSYTYGTKPHAVTSVGAMTYAYDANGNMITRNNQILDWDAENRLIAVSQNGTTIAQFFYDGDGNRVKKIENGEVTIYVNRYYEKNLTTGNVTTSYYLGGRLVAIKENEILRYVHQDHLTGTSLMTDSIGTQIGETMKYLPFGETLAGSVPTDKKFTGQRLDETGLYYYNARYYNATIGRFISADTIVQSPANPQNLNRYSYCINNPLSCIDPSGRDYIFVCGSGGKPEDWNTMREALNIPEDERVLYVYEKPGSVYQGGGFLGLGGWEIQDQVVELSMILYYEDLTDIKLIGHSEGAAAIITVLDKIAENGGYIGEKDVGTELEAAILIEAPTVMGADSDWIIGGWDVDRYNNLPQYLANAGLYTKLLDVWNEASLAHSTCPMPGWGPYSWSYSSVTWWNPFTWFHNYHNDPLTNHEVIEKIQETINS